MSVRWLLFNAGMYTHLIPEGDVIGHEVDPARQPCVCLPLCHPMYCKHGEHVGWLLEHSLLCLEPQGPRHD